MNLPTDQQLSLMRCVACGDGALSIGDRPAGLWTDLRLPVADKCLVCTTCQERYPLTDCGIPVLWTAPLKAYLQKLDNTVNPLSANAEIYNATSSDYADNIRQYPKTASRIRTAAAESIAQNKSNDNRPRRHLDVGCGPGHVLNWLKDLKLQQWGLDISIENLRNARARTGAYVVLGSADNMPFRADSFDVVTESSVLHHIEDWKGMLRETARVCAPGGAIILDSEPSTDTKDWSLLARLLFQCRWYPYKLMSYIKPDKFWFRDLKQAKLNYFQAEIHNQPGGGFALEELKQCYRTAGVEPTVYLTPGERMDQQDKLPIKSVILHLLSGHNPKSPRYGMFSVVARKTAK